MKKGSKKPDARRFVQSQRWTADEIAAIRKAYPGRNVNRIIRLLVLDTLHGSGNFGKSHT